MTSTPSSLKTRRPAEWPLWEVSSVARPLDHERCGGLPADAAMAVR